MFANTVCNTKGKGGFDGSFQYLAQNFVGQRVDEDLDVSDSKTIAEREKSLRVYSLLFIEEALQGKRSEK